MKWKELLDELKMMSSTDLEQEVLVGFETGFVLAKSVQFIREEDKTDISELVGTPYLETVVTPLSTEELIKRLREMYGDSDER